MYPHYDVPICQRVSESTKQKGDRRSPIPKRVRVGLVCARKKGRCGVNFYDKVFEMKY